jgi:Pyruvate/2-oxoacid:ferredoxin oxidoreductase gamma subunit
VCAAIREQFPARIAAANISAATEAYEEAMKSIAREAAHA